MTGRVAIGQQSAGKVCPKCGHEFRSGDSRLGLQAGKAVLIHCDACRTYVVPEPRKIVL